MNVVQFLRAAKGSGLTIAQLHTIAAEARKLKAAGVPDSQLGRKLKASPAVAKLDLSGIDWQTILDLIAKFLPLILGLL